MNNAALSEALRLIAKGYTLLADAIAEPDVASAAKDVKEGKTSANEARKAAGKDKEEQPEKEPAQEPDKPANEVEEVTLEDLQELGASLLRAKKRDVFVKVLADRDLKNLSAAKKEDYKAIWDELTEGAK